MTFDFFADRIDKLKILEFIFEQTDLRVFDLSSEYGKLVNEYYSAKEIDEKFDLNNETIHLNLWSSRLNGNILFRKIELNPKYCNGFTFRYSTDGWGLIQLYLGGLEKNKLHKSHLGHFNEKGARANEPYNLFNGKVDDWNWEEIKKASGKLKYHIQKSSTSKIHSSVILPGAQNLKDYGTEFILA